MASQVVEFGHLADIASHQGPDIRHQSAQNKPLPTDSMVTVRLSDISSLQVSDTSTPENTPLPDSLRETIEASGLATTEGSVIVDGKDEAAVNDMPEPVALSKVTMSMICTYEEGSLASAAPIIRSRSDSSGTLSSNGSAQVDWEELEKSEEQAPRDEGSDEVRTCFFVWGLNIVLTKTSQRLFSSPDLSKRTTLLQPIRKRSLPEQDQRAKAQKHDLHPFSISRSSSMSQQGLHFDILRFPNPHL